MMQRRTERIPFEVEVSRIIEVLATQIYQTPLALLRENAQNAFDATLLRGHLVGPFDPAITVVITENEISVADNGIGMTAEDLREHYWRAGSSGKNNPEARAAGVVGTFGIGAMANFGIARELVVETESAITGERTRSSAERDTLSTTEDCIVMEAMEATGQPGTTVRALISDGGVNVDEAVRYISDFVGLVDVPVTVNGAVVSRQTLLDAVPPPADADEIRGGALSGRLGGQTAMRVTGTGDVWVHITELQFDGAPVRGELVLRQGQNAIRTFRSGFGLAVVSASSHYNFGGVADVSVLQPTAGREALTTASMQVLQETLASLDEIVSLALADRTEATSSTPFMQWVRNHGRYELCGKLLVRVEPQQQVTLESLRQMSEQAPILVDAGSDQSIIQASATDDSPLVIVASANPRRQCEQEYLRQY